VYISQRKEPHFFGSDLAIDYGVKELADYLALFEKGQGLLCGEGSVFYLYSHNAAQEIYDFNPTARIIIMLRNPIDLMYSMHNQRIYSGIEDIEDFEQAIAAEADRWQGRRMPGNYKTPEFFAYIDLAKFTEQIRRYFNVFGYERVHIIIYDDFQRNIAKTYRETLQFLGVAPDFQADFQIVNPSKYWRSKALIGFMRNPPSSIRSVVRTMVPFQMRVALGKIVNRVNTNYRARPPMNPVLRRHLQQQFVPEVVQLSALLGRDLLHWTEVAE
jgi:hypothetical protein